MTDIDWRGVVEADSSPAALRAYADWLAERGMSGPSLAQRLLALARFGVRNGRWEIDTPGLPEEVRRRLHFFRQPGTEFPTDPGMWHAPHRYVLEAVMVDTAHTVLMNGVDLAALVDALERKELR